MELDKRILPGKYILTCFDTEEAKQFIGKKCYFTNDITSFAYLDNLNKGKLTSVGDDEINPYKHVGERGSYATNFILPFEWVQSTEEQQEFITDSKRVAMHIQDYLQHNAYPPSGIIARHSGKTGEKQQFLQNVFEILLDYYKG